MRPGELSIPSCTCARCGHKWYLRKPETPISCPKCKSPYWNTGDSEYKQQLKVDLAKTAEINSMLLASIQRASGNRLYWGDITSIGFERMLKTSDFPIKNIQRVLDGGFSIYDWFLKVPGVIKPLVNDILFKVTPESIVGHSDNGLENAIRKVLEWDKVVNTIDIESIKILSFLWFADLQARPLQFSDSQALVQVNAWTLLEQTLGKSKLQIISRIDELTNQLDVITSGATTWAEVIRFP